MAVELSKDEIQQVIPSIQKYCREELDADIGELGAKLLLNYILEEIAPLAYNKGVNDAEAYLLTRVEDMRGTCFQQGLTYWKQRRK